MRYSRAMYFKKRKKENTFVNSILDNVERYIS